MAGDELVRGIAITMFVAITLVVLICVRLATPPEDETTNPAR